MLFFNTMWEGGCEYINDNDHEGSAENPQIPE